MKKRLWPTRKTWEGGFKVAVVDCKKAVKGRVRPSHISKEKGMNVLTRLCFWKKDGKKRDGEISSSSFVIEDDILYCPLDKDLDLDMEANRPYYNYRNFSPHQEYINEVGKTNTSLHPNNFVQKEERRDYENYGGE